MKCIALLMDAPIALILVVMFLFSMLYATHRKSSNFPKVKEQSKFDKSDVLDLMEIILALIVVAFGLIHCFT